MCVSHEFQTDQFVRAMVTAGLLQGQAEFLARETARSIPVLQRRIAASGIPGVPDWARPENAQSLVPVLLASSWTESNAADCDALEQLGESPYTEIQRTVSRWASESDTPIQRIGAEWSLVSPLDAWHLLSRFLTSHDLERVSRVAVQVLSIEIRLWSCLQGIGGRVPSIRSNFLTHPRCVPASHKR